MPIITVNTRAAVASGTIQSFSIRTSAKVVDSRKEVSRLSLVQMASAMGLTPCAHPARLAAHGVPDAAQQPRGVPQRRSEPDPLSPRGWSHGWFPRSLLPHRPVVTAPAWLPPWSDEHRTGY